MSHLKIAQVCYETNRAYCETLGDTSQKPWLIAPDWAVDTVLAGVAFHAEHPDATDADSHNEWLKQKRAEGWTYGDVRDVEAKKHPCMKPFEELPPEQQVKDRLFKAICEALL